ncbi:MAG TPA: methyltransferase domain-containing protein [Chloroflexia bacterium]|nr:methyltransferase domain-containing protein [Chloroflexia bacterium]
MDEPAPGLQSGYDAVADEYAAHFLHELDHKPLDRALLDWFAGQVRDRGVVADMGCGPGQIGRYLHDRGVPMVGIDLSPAMVALAQQITPAIPFGQGNMLALAEADDSWAGIVAFYSLVHLPSKQLPVALAEFYRVLRPGGLLLLSFHLGDERVHLDDWWDHPVALDFYFHQRATMEAALMAVGFTVEAYLERQPYVPVEHPSRRAYVAARRPTEGGGA